MERKPLTDTYFRIIKNFNTNYNKEVSANISTYKRYKRTVLLKADLGSKKIEKSISDRFAFLLDT
ncbi:MAG: hypothetical protein JW786_02055 [Desulfobacterales bacterium]|nr:hypothetical protein [Desulfobacterales bacterium]